VSNANIIIIIIIKGIYIAQVRKGHKCAISAEMAVWFLTVYVSIAMYITNCLCAHELQITNLNGVPKSTGVTYDAVM